MKIKINKTLERPLLSRSRIYAEVEFEKAIPPRKDVIQKLAEMLSADPNLIVVKKIHPFFGSHTARIAAYLYTSVKERDRIEEKKVLVKTGFNIPKLEKKAAPVAQ